VPMRTDEREVKDMPRVEIFIDSVVCSGAADFAMRTRSGILRLNRSARRRSVRVMGVTFSLLIREPWNQIDIPPKLLPSGENRAGLGYPFAESEQIVQTIRTSLQANGCSQIDRTERQINARILTYDCAAEGWLFS
jgi:hypothetical protein